MNGWAWVLDVLAPVSTAPAGPPAGLGSPAVLLAGAAMLAPACWLAWQIWARPGTEPVPYGPFALVAGSQPPSRARYRRAVALLLLVVAGVLGVLAGSMPWVRSALATQLGTVMLVVDVSGSMQADDVDPDRITAAGRAAAAFAREVPADLKVGLVTYSSQATLSVPPTLDRAPVVDALDLLVPRGATATGDALSKALAAGLDSTGSRPGSVAIVLLSDGSEQKSTVPAMEVAEQAKSWDVPVHTIALGTAAGTVRVFDQQGQRYVNRPVPPDPELMYALSDITRGQSFAALDSASLRSVYERIRAVVVPRPVRRDLAPALGLAAAACLLAAGLLARRPLP